MDWNYVIDQENVFGKKLVPKNYSDSWKNTTPGQYNSVDLLVLQRHILEIEIFRKATNINKNGNKPTSVDLLLIQRHILGLQTIKQ